MNTKKSSRAAAVIAAAFGLAKLVSQIITGVVSSRQKKSSTQKSEKK